MPQKGFDGGKGFMPGPSPMAPGLKGGPPGPGLQPFGGGMPPPPPGGMAPLLPANGNLTPFAKGQATNLAPELLALTEAEQSIHLIDDGPGLKAMPTVPEKKQ